MAKVQKFRHKTPKETGPVRYIAIPLEGVTTEEPLPYPLYVRVAGKYILFRPQGDELSLERKRSLLNKVDTIFISHNFWDTYLSSLSKIVFHPSTDKNESKSSILLEKHDELKDSIFKARQMLLAMLSEFENEWRMPPDELHHLRKLASAIGEFVHKAPQHTKNLVWTSDSLEGRISSHMLNVAVYSAAIGSRHKLSATEIDKLIFACMVHDIGKFTLPKELFFKKSLTEKEQALVNTHPEKGAKLLEDVFNDPSICIPAIQHHERSDGNGFPHGLKDNEIHLHAKICMVADVFDSLTRPRPYRLTVHTPNVAIEMMRHMKHRFDSSIFLG